jgi:signal transduction histidine kinase
LWRGVWIAVPIASVLTALAAGYATGRALRPVDEIAALAGALGPHDTTTRVPLPDTGDEIEHLARTVNAMLDRIADGRRAQQRFTSDAAHELRTPLMALQCEIELAADDPAAIDPALRERITALLARLSTCTDDLLLLSTLDEGRPVAQAPVDLAALLRSEVDALPRGRHLTLHVTDLSVLGDEPLLRRAVANVLANATRHAATTVEVGLVAQDGTVCVHVDDDGPGIDAEARVRVLDRFARLDEARGPGGGAGLGLSIAAAVVERHGGEVSIATSPLGGARVSFRFPDPPPFCLEQKCAAAGDAGRTMGAC